MSSIVKKAEAGPAWSETYGDIIENGDRLGSRDGSCLEILGHQAKFVDPTRAMVVSPTRKTSPEYAGAELLWYLAGSRETAPMEAYAKQYARFGNEGIAMGAYGDRMMRNLVEFNDAANELENEKGTRVGNQISAAVEELRSNPESRRCVISMWRSSDLVEAVRGEWNDVPCTVCIQFLLRDEKLHANVYMRSNDWWLGMPYDMWCFCQLQLIIANRVGARPGTYTHSVGSMHAYNRDIEKVSNRYAPGKNRVGVLALPTEHNVVATTWCRAGGPRGGDDVKDNAIKRCIELEEVARTSDDAWDCLKELYDTFGDNDRSGNPAAYAAAFACGKWYVDALDPEQRKKGREHVLSIARSVGAGNDLEQAYRIKHSMPRLEGVKKCY